MSLDYCIVHKKKHDSFGWKNRGKGWFCDDNVSYPEFTTKAIKEGREKFAADMVQETRGGQLSREFVELYPDRIRGKIKEGLLTKKQVKDSKYVWRGDIKHWQRNKKIDADMI